MFRGFGADVVADVVEAGVGMADAVDRCFEFGSGEVAAVEGEAKRRD